MDIYWHIVLWVILIVHLFMKFVDIGHLTHHELTKGTTGGQKPVHMFGEMIL